MQTPKLFTDAQAREWEAKQALREALKHLGAGRVRFLTIDASGPAQGYMIYDVDCRATGIDDMGSINVFLKPAPQGEDS